MPVVEKQFHWIQSRRYTRTPRATYYSHQYPEYLSQKALLNVLLKHYLKQLESIISRLVQISLFFFSVQKPLILTLANLHTAYYMQFCRRFTLGYRGGLGFRTTKTKMSLISWATCKVGRVQVSVFYLSIYLSTYLSIYLSIYHHVTIVYADVMHAINTFMKTRQSQLKMYSLSNDRLRGQFLA